MPLILISTLLSRTLNKQWLLRILSTLTLQMIIPFKNGSRMDWRWGKILSYLRRSSDDGPVRTNLGFLEARWTIRTNFDFLGAAVRTFWGKFLKFRLYIRAKISSGLGQGVLPHSNVDQQSQTGLFSSTDSYSKTQNLTLYDPERLQFFSFTLCKKINKNGSRHRA